MVTFTNLHAINAMSFNITETPTLQSSAGEHHQVQLPSHLEDLQRHSRLFIK